jgi:hypothetical protein
MALVDATHVCFSDSVRSPDLHTDGLTALFYLQILRFKKTVLSADDVA